MDEIESTASSEEVPLCPVCGEALHACDKPECPAPAEIAEAALCQRCGLAHDLAESCEIRRAEHIRQASLDTPFKLGI